MYQIIIDETKIQRTPAKFKVSGRIRMKPVTVRSVLPETFDVPFSEESKKYTIWWLNKEVQSMNTMVVNCYAGPGAGKTTCAWEVASQLKKKGINTEYVSEYAKELVWEGKYDVLENQEHLFAEQAKRSWKTSWKGRSYSNRFADFDEPHLWPKQQYGFYNAYRWWI